MDDFENMNEVEHRFATYIATAPDEQRAHFRATLNTLMQCYDSNPRVGLLAAVVDKVEGTLTVSAINLDSAEILLIAKHTLDTLMTATEGAPTDVEMH